MRGAGAAFGENIVPIDADALLRVMRLWPHSSLLLDLECSIVSLFVDFDAKVRLREGCAPRNSPSFLEPKVAFCNAAISVVEVTNKSSAVLLRATFCHM